MNLRQPRAMRGPPENRTMIETVLLVAWSLLMVACGYTLCDMKLDSTHDCWRSAVGDRYEQRCAVCGKRVGW